MPLRGTRSVLANGLLLVVSVGVAMVAAEAGARLLLDVTGNERTVVPDAVRGWRLAANVDKLYSKEEQPYRIITNSRGLRDREHSYEKLAGVFRIVVIGDSMTFGAGGVESNQRYTDLLEASRPNMEVINLGVPAYSTDQELLYLKEEGLRYHPDLVLLAVFANDLQPTSSLFDNSIRRPKGRFLLQGEGLEFVPPRFSAIYRLSGPSVVFALADTVMRSRNWGAYSHIDLDRRPREEQAEIFRRLLAEFARESRGAGARFAAVYLPGMWETSRGRLPALVDEVAGRIGFPALDLSGVLNADPSLYYRKDIHINAAGHRFVFARVSAWLAENGLLGRGGEK